MPLLVCARLRSDYALVRSRWRRRRRGESKRPPPTINGLYKSGELASHKHRRCGATTSGDRRASVGLAHSIRPATAPARAHEQKPHDASDCVQQARAPKSMPDLGRSVCNRRAAAAATTTTTTMTTTPSVQGRNAARFVLAAKCRSGRLAIFADFFCASRNVVDHRQHSFCARTRARSLADCSCITAAAKLAWQASEQTQQRRCLRASLRLRSRFRRRPHLAAAHRNHGAATLSLACSRAQVNADDSNSGGRLLEQRRSKARNASGRKSLDVGDCEHLRPNAKRGAKTIKHMRNI